jgi:poly-gamma-glutamate synthesis protein (capsule biosynthesis protein)
MCFVRLLLGGDALIARPWSRVADPRFLALVEEMRGADVTILNLETLIHEHSGYAQADSGGIWVASPPEIAGELAWAGVNMVAQANNHAFDFGSIGVLENLEHVEKAGLVLAGSGPDLQAARAPRYFRHARGSVALVSAASDFVRYGRASPSRADLHGRPGLNPLTVVQRPLLQVTQTTADRLGRVVRPLGYSGTRFRMRRFRVAGVGFRVGERHRILGLGRRVDEDDRDGNLASIREAAQAAQLVVVSVHAHLQGPWLRRFAHAALEAGAHAFFVHGPHAVRGIEIHAGRPIFYGLGDFVFEPHLMDRQPPEHYDALGLNPDAPPSALRTLPSPLETRREAWEGLAAVVDFRDGRPAAIRLLPLDLGFGEPPATRGIPRLARPDVGQAIISEVTRRSRAYGTRIRYSMAESCGIVKLPD